MNKLVDSRTGGIFSSFILLFLLVSPATAYDDIIDSPMYKKPDVPAPPLALIFPDKAKALWLRALEQPEADVKCKVADAIALGRRRGMKDLDITIDPLLAALDQPDQHAAVRLAVARTLIALDARKAAPILWRHAQAAGGDLREIVEPALARWDYAPARAVWLERLRDPKTPQRSLILAIQGLATVNDEQAVDSLREIVLREQGARKKEEKSGTNSDSSLLLPPSPSVRLEAARALGSLRRDGLENDAERLAQDPSPRGLPARLCAASLLRHHRGKDAVATLQHLLEDKEPAVGALAAAGLIEVDPELVVAMLERLFANPDANMRAAGVEVLFRLPTEKHIRLLADRLDDVHMDVRMTARRYMLELAAKKELLDAVVGEAKRILATEQWRGLEQAAILLTQLDRKETAERLVALLPFNRPEVAVAAAWGLRKLDVAESLPGVTDYVESALKHSAGPFRTPDLKDAKGAMLDHQLSQLYQFLGQRKYDKAENLLIDFVPRRNDYSWFEARAAAIWALGMIHDGKPNAGLARALEARLNDTRTLPPEDPRVRRMSAIGLARLQAQEALPSLEKTCPTFEISEDPVASACGWAIEQLTGKKMPPVKPVFKAQGGWFLLPLDR